MHNVNSQRTQWSVPIEEDPVLGVPPMVYPYSVDVYGGLLRMWSVAIEEDPVLGVPAMVYPYSAGVYGGLLGSLGMLPFAIIYGMVSGYGIWYPVNLIAATIIWDWQQAAPEQLGQFSFIGLVIGLLLHILMSTGLGLLFTAVLPTLPGTPLFWSFVVGPLLWFGATVAGLPLLNPVMAHLVDLPSFAFANIVYSFILGFWVARTPKVPAN